MKKIITVFSLISLLALSAMPLMAKTPKNPADYNGLNKGKSKVNHLYLYEKDPTSWEIIEDGAWGKMNFNEDNFVFNGHGLEPNVDLTLIRYTDPWPGSPVCLASGTSNNGGNLNLLGEMQDGGSKVWLVLSGDVDCENSTMTGWNPTEYLFEYNTI